MFNNKREVGLESKEIAQDLIPKEGHSFRVNMVKVQSTVALILIE